MLSIPPLPPHVAHPISRYPVSQLLELMREEKVRISSKRAREARELELKKKPKMIMGKSKG